MSKKQPRRARQTTRRLPDKTLVLLDRARVAWQDHQGTWCGPRGTDSYVQREAPPGFNIIAMLQPDNLSTGFGPYLWIGIAAPDTHEARQCYAIIKGDSLRELATELLKYFDATTKERAR